MLDVRLRRDTVPSFDAYPFALPAVRALDVCPLHPKVTFVIGENGSGKSTLLEAVPDADPWLAGDDGLVRIAYEETEHYRVTRDFPGNPRRMLDVLLVPEE